MADQQLSPRRPWNGAIILSDDILVHRPIENAEYLRGGLRTAIFMRAASDQFGLGVSDAHVCSPERCCEESPPCFGIVSLQVGKIRGLGLDVQPDNTPHPCGHGLILNLPSVHAAARGEWKRAEYLATQLRAIIEDTWQKP